tara:strand:+ start:1738 stop:2514 length:777 start_codon:yes stop_codon:yes gene_type:complete
MKIHSIYSFLIISSFTLNVYSQDVSEVSSDELIDSVSITTSSLKDASSKQKQINKIDKETRELEFEYIDTFKEYENLKLYNDQLQKIINSQMAEIESILQQIADLDNTNINIIPLMLKMTDSLETFIELDLPFLLDERKQRLKSIREVMDRGDISTSEKFRKVAEAYQIENEYGRTIEAYRGSVNFNDKDFNADFLRIGRVALMFVTTNGDTAAYWDTSSKSWVKSSSAIKRSTEEGLKIALKQSPPTLITIPITSNE